MSTTKRINQKKVDQIGYQRGRWAIYLFLAIVVVCQLLPFYFDQRLNEASDGHVVHADAAPA